MRWVLVCCRANVVTEDLDRLFTKRQKSPQGLAATANSTQ